jgi:hypothetical protein
MFIILDDTALNLDNVSSIDFSRNKAGEITKALVSFPDVREIVYDEDAQALHKAILEKEGMDADSDFINAGKEIDRQATIIHHLSGKLQSVTDELSVTRRRLKKLSVNNEK